MRSRKRAPRRKRTHLTAHRRAVADSKVRKLIDELRDKWKGTGRIAEKKSAAVLNIVATYSSSGSGSGYVVPSAVSKAGVQALTRSLAVEWGSRGIRMNAIAPGPIPTEGAFSRLLPKKELEKLAIDRIPLRRFGTPEELANLAAFLVSDGAAYINGEIVTMDGGEWLQGAGEFNYLGYTMTDADWEKFKPTKKG